MATCLTCPRLPTGIQRYPSVPHGVHESRSYRQIILDFLRVAKGTMVSRACGGEPLDVSPGRAVTRMRDRVTSGRVMSGGRQPRVVARPRETPQRNHAGPTYVAVMAGAASGKEIPPMSRHRQTVTADESHESAKKNLTRRLPHTLPSYPSSQNAGTLGAIILIHGATDASGR